MGSIMSLEKLEQLKVKDVMCTRKLISVEPDMLARDVSVIFAENNISGAPVLNEDRELMGVVSLSDIARSEAILDLKGVLELIFFNSSDEIKSQIDEHLKDNYSELVASDIMTPNPITTQEDDTVKSAVKIMLDNRIHRIIVLKEDKVIGLLSITDILKLLAGEK